MSRTLASILTRFVVVMLILLAFLPAHTAATTSGDLDKLAQITRQPRGGEDEEAANTSGLQTYTGPVYGYSVNFDPEVWTLDEEINEGNVDGVRLVRENSTFTVWAWDAYGSDPLHCLDGEAEYYSTGIDTISNWEPAVGTNGQPLRYESDTLAWGVFNLTFTTSQGTETPLVDYISCEPIPGQDAALIVLLSSNPDTYNEELDHALDVLDTLQFGDAADTTTTTAGDTGDDSILVEIDTQLSGTEYTSPYYGFTADIPLEWQILEETANGSEELLVLSNGTSTVTLWATQAYSGDLAGCVDFAAESSGLRLTLDRDSSGGAFRGVYRNEAFGNFVYVDNGVEMMYYINCQVISDTGGALIIIHDVEYSQFTAERGARIAIENSIVMP